MTDNDFSAETGEFDENSLSEYTTESSSPVEAAGTRFRGHQTGGAGPSTA